MTVAGGKMLDAKRTIFALTKHMRFEEIAKRVGVTERSIYRYANGGRPRRKILNKIEKLAVELDCAKYR